MNSSAGILLLVVISFVAPALQATNVLPREVQLRYPLYSEDGRRTIGDGDHSCTSTISARSSTVSHVRYVDNYITPSGNQNILFRGGDPDILGYYQFDYDALVSSMERALKGTGVTMPSTFYMIDISFLNMYDGHQAVRNSNEWLYFNQNPQKGAYVFWETKGERDDPLDTYITPAMFNFTIQNYATYSHDMMTYRVSQLRELFHTDMNIPVVVYGHCLCGCDRTGQMFGSYMMQYMNATWEDTVAYDRAVPNRDIDCQNYLAMQWHCFFLRDASGDSSYAHLNCEKDLQDKCRIKH